MRVLACLPILLLIAAPRRAEVQVLFSPRGGIQDRIVAEIRAAKKQIHVAVFTFTSEPLARALIDARGKNDKLDVRVLIDWYQYHDMGRDLVKGLLDGGVSVKLVDLGDGERRREQPRFHHKYAVIDGETVLTGSFNWTNQAENENHEDLVVLKGERKAASAYVEEFKRVWDKEARDVPR